MKLDSAPGVVISSEALLVQKETPLLSQLRTLPGNESIKTVATAASLLYATEIWAQDLYHSIALVEAAKV